MKLKDTIKNESERMKQKVKSTTVNYEKSRKTTTWNSRFFMINDISGQFEHDIVEKNGILNAVVFLYLRIAVKLLGKKAPQHTFDQWVFSRGYIV